MARRSPLRAEALRADRLTVVYGSGSLAEDSSVIEKALVTLADALPDATFLPALHRGNVMGALDMGLAPGLLPGRVGLGDTPGSWASAPTERGLDTEQMLRLAADGGVDVAILLGCDPLTDFPDAHLAEQAFNKVEHLIAVDCLLNFTSTGADIVFPAAASAIEADGTFTNIEGRVSPVSRRVTPPGTARPDWMIAAELAAQLGADLGFIDLDELWSDLASASSLHAELALDSISDAGLDSPILTSTSISAPSAALVNIEGDGPTEGLQLVVTRKMYDEGTILTNCPSLQSLAGGAHASVNPGELSSRSLDSGDEVTLTNEIGSITVPVRADDGVARGTVAVEFNQPNASVAQLLDAGRIVTSVRMESAS